MDENKRIDGENRRLGKKVFGCITDFLRLAIVGLFFSCIIISFWESSLRDIFKENNNPSTEIAEAINEEEELVTSSDVEEILEIILNSRNVEDYAGLISIEEAEDERIIQEFVRRNYAYPIILNEKYSLKVSIYRELILVYKDDNGIQYETNIGINIDVPLEERLYGNIKMII